MSFALIYTRALVGISAVPVQVEVQLSNGLPQFNLVGLPDAQVRESRERVRAALQNSGFAFPQRRITVNLAPANLPKQSSHFDLPIALGILQASGQVANCAAADWECAGELALSGEIRRFRGALPMAIAAKRSGRELWVAQSVAGEAALAPTAVVRAADCLGAVCAYLNGRDQLLRVSGGEPAPCDAGLPDMREVRGQFRARRTLEIAAAGGHHLLLRGPPGCGKTMLAQRLRGICPPLPVSEALELAALQSLGGEQELLQRWRQRPHRIPHHTCTLAAMAGGGIWASPGEVSQAHCGILQLDEVPEFERRVLEVLREPLESGEINVARAQRKVTYPARFQLVGTMNPCPCGYLGHPSGRCNCTPEQVRRYEFRLSGPLLDRIDLMLDLPFTDSECLLQAAPGEPSAPIRARVGMAQEVQRDRQGKLNSRLQGEEIQSGIALAANAEIWLRQAAQQLGLSGRAQHRVLRVGRTIADLSLRANVGSAELAEALSYRAFSGT